MGTMPQDLSLRTVVVAAQHGDHGAWSELVARFQDFAVGMAVACAGDWDGAPDAAQEAFGIAFRKLADLEDPDAFPGWFATLVRTACSRRTRVKRLAVASLEGVDVADIRQRDPATIVADADEQQHIRVAVEALPEAERAVIALHYLGDLSYPEVAAFLDITVAAAKKRAFTARRRLEEMLPMATDALAAARPSRTDRFRDTIRLFVAIRDRDVDTVARLIRTDPALVHATEDWSMDEALAVGLPFAFAGRASALIRAAETGDVELVRLFVEAGAPVRDVCNCAGAESPLWAASVRGDRAVVEYLLDAGADPNTPAFAGATPLHVAMQRDHHELVPRLLEAGADPDRVDDHGRTPADWLAFARRTRSRPTDRFRVRTHGHPRGRSLRAAALRARAALAARGRPGPDGAPVRDRRCARARGVLARRLRARSVQPGRGDRRDARDRGRLPCAARARRRRRESRVAPASAARSRSACSHRPRSSSPSSKDRVMRTMSSLPSPRCNAPSTS